MAAPQSDVQISEVTFPLPRSIDTQLFLRLENRANSLMVFLTTVEEALPGTMSESLMASLGSFVYAIPDPRNLSKPMTTALYSVQNTTDMTIRLATVVAKKSGKPAYVGNSINLASTGMGGDPEEEFAIFKKVLDVVMEKLATRSQSQ